MSDTELALELGIIAAVFVCDAALAYGIRSDYLKEKKAGNVRSFREYFSKKVF
jgi:hypothetical protein